MRPPIIVMTVGHTGSSALVEMLHHCGMWVGDCVSRHKDYWENRHFMGVNTRLMEGYEALVEAPPEPDLDIEQVRGEAYGAIEDQGWLGEPWGWKNPSTVRLASFWRKVFPDALWLFMQRDRADIALDPNLYKDNDDLLDVRLGEWRSAWRATPESQCRLIDYNTLSYDTGAALQVLCAGLGLSPSPERLAKACRVWRPKFKGKYLDGKQQ